MKITNLDEFINYIEVLGFKVPNGHSSFYYEKKYTKLDDFRITITIDKDDYTRSVIDYGNPETNGIKLGRTTTTKFHQQETFVVLECINRLLDIGYKPYDIVLEQPYPSGRRDEGQYLDILIQQDNLPYYMIECKTAGEEYQKELNRLKADGGQLFTYYSNERDIKKLILYSSSVENKEIKLDYAIIDSSELYGSGKKELYKIWDKEIFTTGIFNVDYVYDKDTKGIQKKDLIHLSEQNTIYNRFAEILRKNAISDYSNAFNKLFNLFLCKIVDEDDSVGHTDEYEMKFQWKKEETAYKVFDRISNLYEKGIKNYLRFNISDYSTESIENDLKHIEDMGIKEKLISKFNSIRFEKNNEFSFIDVFNKSTFQQNALIVKDIIKILERVQIKYSDKQQFLGDFFERLLNIGIKQSEGQFFTPIPIANFIVNSIPFEDIIENKIKAGDDKFLPYMIDYACGAGHFLTEYIHRIDKLLPDLNVSGKQAIDNKKQWENSYKWAGEFVCGIEKDYRLSKTSKIACFLNGDGDANIITANGLDTFDSEDYKNTLLYNDSIDGNLKDNPKFDVVIANPPYSVKGFRDTLKHSDEYYGDKTFDLDKEVTPKSSSIECLFVERAKQLLKEGGYTGIILPVSFLSNNGLHNKAREICLKNFRIKAIVYLGENAFMATNTKTIVLFMQKRYKNEVHEVEYLLSDMYTNFLDFAYNGKTDVITTFAFNTYELNFNDYISLFKCQLTKTFMLSDLFVEYYENKIQKMEKSLEKKNLTRKKRDKILDELNIYKNDMSLIPLNDLITSEKNKLLFYLLNNSVKTIIVKTGDNIEDRRKFLGYMFSTRKGSEGMKELTSKELNEVELISNRKNSGAMLYNPKELLDKSKINYYIYKNFQNNLSEQEILSDNILYSNLNELLTYDSQEFDCKISPRASHSITEEQDKIDSIVKSIINDSEYNIVKLKTIAEIVKGTSITQAETQNGNIKVVAGGITYAYLHNKYNREKYTITVSASGANAGYVNFWEEKIFASDCTTIRADNDITTEYIYYILKSKQNKIYTQSSGQAQPHIYPKDLQRIEIPYPSFEIQQKVVAKIRLDKEKVNELKIQIEKLQKDKDGL